jgi:A/G-specific adenine glycosylase
MRPKRKTTPHHAIAACVIRKQDKVLITRRRADQMLGGLWEFPGGKQQRGESLQQTARREIREELGIGIRVGRRLCRIRHAYSHFSVTLHTFECRHVRGAPRAIEVAALKWVPVNRLRRYPFSAADIKIIDVLEA